MNRCSNALAMAVFSTEDMTLRQRESSSIAWFDQTVHCLANAPCIYPCRGFDVISRIASLSVCFSTRFDGADPRRKVTILSRGSLGLRAS
jgi:hypothetical protein